MDATNSLGLSTDELFGEAANEFFAAVARGEQPSLSDFAERYPEIAEHIRRTFPALLLVGTLSGDGEHMNEMLPGESKTLGDFRLIREIGRGGMGTVFEAEQLSMGRRVALKVLPFAALVNETSLQRFRNEVRAAAALNHPHIVPVYSIGEERSIHFYAMQLVRGRTLADFIEELRKAGQSSCRELSGKGPARLAGPTGSDAPTIDSAASLPATKRVEQGRISTVAESRRDTEDYRVAARLGIEAAAALQHAHDQGVLHRDIKPGNLLLDGDGKLYVTDFGLARIEADAGLTMTGDIVGTLRYMAPEQALTKRVVIDHRADIYSLGATLYELLTLQPAFGETDRSELLKQIAFEEPRLLRKLDRHIPAELETIVHKAIRKNPDERYQSAQQLADDLRAFLEDRPIRAKRPTLINRCAKWSRRHPAVICAAVLFLLATAIASATSAVIVMQAYRREAAQREIAEEERTRAQDALEIAQNAVNGSTRELVQTLEGNVGVQPIIDKFLSDGLEFYNSLLKVAGDDPAVVDSRAQYLITLSRIYTVRDHFEEARKYYDEAVDALRKLVERFPENQSYGRSLTYAVTSRALWLDAFGRHREAIQLAREAVAYRQRKLDAEPGNFKKQVLLADALDDLSHCQLSAGDIQAALDSSDATNVLLRQLLVNNATLPWLRHFRAHGLIHRGDVLVKKERLSDAYESYQAGIKIERELITNEPAYVTASIRLASGLQASADVLLKQKKPDAALGFVEEAEQICRPMVAPSGRGPDVLWFALIVKAKALVQLDRTQDAANAVHEACQYARKSDDVRNRDELARRLSTSSSDICRDGKCAVELALKVCEAVQYENPSFVDTLACAYAEAGDFDSARKWSEKSLELTTEDREQRDFKKHLEVFRQDKPWRDEKI